MARKEPLAKIADALKRTAGAARQKATNLGVSLNMSPNKRSLARLSACAKSSINDHQCH
jgi:hypothetical protein